MITALATTVRGTFALIMSNNSGKSDEASGEGTTTVVVRCAGDLPVEEQPCVLDVAKGQQARFKCQNPNPKDFPLKLLTWTGKESTPAAEIGDGTVITKDEITGEYVLDIKSSRVTTVGATCSAMKGTTQQVVPRPDKQTAQQLRINSIVIRVNGGVPESRRGGFASSRCTSRRWFGYFFDVGEKLPNTHIRSDSLLAIIDEAEGLSEQRVRKTL